VNEFYSNKRAVVVGCASGMGEAVTNKLVAAGARVHGFDIKPSTRQLDAFDLIDLKDPASIDEAAGAIEGKIDCLFYCAGLPQTFPAIDVMKVNYIGLRHLLRRFEPLMAPSSAIAVITSMGGMGWHEHLALHNELLATPTFEDAVAWCERHAEDVADGYAFSKEAANVLVQVEGTRLIRKGIRINATCPSPTNTPMMPDFEKVTGAAFIDVFTLPIDRRATAEEQADPLLFLNSDAASFVNGHLLNVDGGFFGGVVTGRIDIMKLMEQARA
jgi:NAD(P)-dependent dehydrogenase (short-subunit alcohol dehydrogenase family)